MCNKISLHGNSVAFSNFSYALIFLNTLDVFPPNDSISVFKKNDILWGSQRPKVLSLNPPPSVITIIHHHSAPYEMKYKSFNCRLLFLSPGPITETYVFKYRKKRLNEIFYFFHNDYEFEKSAHCWNFFCWSNIYFNYEFREMQSPAFADLKMPTRIFFQVLKCKIRSIFLTFFFFGLRFVNI